MDKTIDLELTRKEMNEFLLSMYRKRIFFYIALFYAFVFPMIILFLIVTTPSSINISNGFLPIVFFLLSVGMLFYVPYKTWKNYVVKKEEEAFFKYNITNEKITLTSKNTNAEFTWDIIKNIDVTKNLVILYITKVQAHILPRRYFTDLEIVKMKELVTTAQ